jgi:hypothetical protein
MFSLWTALWFHRFLAILPISRHKTRQLRKYHRTDGVA